MNETHYKLIKDRLEKDHKTLDDQLQQIRQSRTAQERREGSPFGKREEEATETQELENLVAQEKRLLGQIADVEAALKKFENKTYGFCDKCGLQIELARLEAMPTAKLCMKDAQAVKSVR
jgi:DnaK suppressor protein